MNSEKINENIEDVKDDNLTSSSFELLIPPPPAHQQVPHENSIHLWPSLTREEANLALKSMLTDTSDLMPPPAHQHIKVLMTKREFMTLARSTPILDIKEEVLDIKEEVLDIKEELLDIKEEVLDIKEELEDEVDEKPCKMAGYTYNDDIKVSFEKRPTFPATRKLPTVSKDALNSAEYNQHGKISFGSMPNLVLTSKNGTKQFPLPSQINFIDYTNLFGNEQSLSRKYDAYGLQVIGAASTPLNSYDNTGFKIKEEKIEPLEELPIKTENPWF